MGVEPSFTEPLRLGVWAGDGDNFHFLDPILARLPARYAVHKYSWPLNEPLDQNVKRMAKEVGSIDMAWFEWATDPAIAGSRLMKDLPTICRLHRYEAYSGNPRAIQWEHIDRLIFVSKGVQETFTRLHKQVVPTLRVTEVIPNGVAVEEFPLKETQERGFNVAFLGRLNLIKNPMLLVQIMARLVQQDPRYTLHVAGAVQDYAVMQYLEYHIRQGGLDRHFVFHGALDAARVKPWLARHHYILTTSVIEGHPVGVMEAMAMGLKPVIHDFVGARHIFPEAFLYNTVDEALARICEEAYQPASYRAFIEEHYSLARQVEAVTRVLDGLARVYYPNRIVKPVRKAS